MKVTGTVKDPDKVYTFAELYPMRHQLDPLRFWDTLDPGLQDAITTAAAQARVLGGLDGLLADVQTKVRDEVLALGCDRQHAAVQAIAAALLVLAKYDENENGGAVLH